jgi:rubrerythrin
MTREEAVKRLKEARSTIQPFRYVDEAIDYAIKSLEQELTEDAISRQAVMEHYSTGEIAHCHHISRNNLLDFVEQLPSVTPMEKVGHWYKKPHEICYTCDQCGTTNASGVKYNFCPHCGARMQEAEG